MANKLYCFVEMPAQWRFASVFVIARSLKRARRIILDRFCDGEIDAHNQGLETNSPEEFRESLATIRPVIMNCEEETSFCVALDDV